MKDDLEQVTSWLLDASSEVGADYLQLPVSGQETPVYRERVYCYELYHRWRCHWDEGLRYSLSGEIDKSGHRLIRGRQKPDFLVHVPGGDPPRNLLVVEVKPRTASLKGFVKDIETLTTFRRNLAGGQNYYAAYLWVYGLDVESWPGLRDRIQHAVAETDRVDLSCVTVLVHPRATEQAQPVGWNTSSRGLSFQE